MGPALSTCTWRGPASRPQDPPCALKGERQDKPEAVSVEGKPPEVGAHGGWHAGQLGLCEDVFLEIGFLPAPSPEQPGRCLRVG